MIACARGGTFVGSASRSSSSSGGHRLCDPGSSLRAVSSSGV